MEMFKQQPKSHHSLHLLQGREKQLSPKGRDVMTGCHQARYQSHHLTGLVGLVGSGLVNKQHVADQTKHEDLDEASLDEGNDAEEGVCAKQTTQRKGMTERG